MTARANPYDVTTSEDAEQLAAISPWYAAHPNARAWGDVLAGWVWNAARTLARLLWWLARLTARLIHSFARLQPWVRGHAWGILTGTIAALLALWATWLWIIG